MNFKKKGERKHLKDEDKFKNHRKHGGKKNDSQNFHFDSDKGVEIHKKKDGGKECVDIKDLVL